MPPLVWGIPLLAGAFVVKYLISNMVLPVIWSPIDNLPGPLTSSYWESNLQQLFE